MKPSFNFILDVTSEEKALGFSLHVLEEEWITRGFDAPTKFIAALCPIGPSDAIFKILRDDGMVTYRQFAFGCSPRDQELPGMWMHAKEKSEYLDAGIALRNADIEAQIHYLPVVRKPYIFKAA